MSEHIGPEIQALIDRGNVTLAELNELRCNSWEWQALVPAMSDEAFLDRMQYALDNCFTPGRRPFSTYNEAVEGLWAPELLKRFNSVADKFRSANKKWQDYERDYILPCFKWAEESGLDLGEAVLSNPGHNCVELLVRWLQTHVRAAKDYAAALDGVREALGQKETHYFCIADDVKQLVEAIESRCDATVVLKRIRGEEKR